MRSGEIDGSFRISQDQIDQWKRISGTSVRLAPELRTAYLSLDTESNTGAANRVSSVWPN